MITIFSSAVASWPTNSFAGNQVDDPRLVGSYLLHVPSLNINGFRKQAVSIRTTSLDTEMMRPLTRSP
jgi:hypothetical protein